MELAEKPAKLQEISKDQADVIPLRSAWRSSLACVAQGLGFSEL